MKTRFITSILLIASIITFLFSSVGCAEVISETPIDTEFITAHDEVVTDYEYKYNAWKGEFVLVPAIKTVHKEDCYKVQYKITYSDGSSYTEWREVDKVTFEDAEKAIAERSEE